MRFLSFGSSEAVETLSQVELLQHASTRQIRQLAGLCVPRDHEVGSTLIQEGGVGLGLFLIRSGRVGIHLGEGEGRVELGEVGPGEVVGEMALLDDQPRSATVVALEAASSYLITRESFRAVTRRHPDLMWFLVPALVDRIRELDSRLVDTLAKLSEAEETGSREDTETTAAESPPADPTPGEEPTEPDTVTAPAPSSLREPAAGPAVAALRLQMHVFEQALLGMERSAEVGREVLSSISDETGLEDGSSFGQVARRFPAGVSRALLKAILPADRWR